MHKITDTMDDIKNKATIYNSIFNFNFYALKYAWNIWITKIHKVFYIEIYLYVFNIIYMRAFIILFIYYWSIFYTHIQYYLSECNADFWKLIQILFSDSKEYIPIRK